MKTLRRLQNAFALATLAALACPLAAEAQTAYGPTTIHNFSGSPTEIGFTYADGALTLGSDGLLYGISSTGTAYPGYFDSVYSMTKDGTLTTLHVFNSALEGAVVNSRLLQLADGSLVGTAKSEGPAGGGTLFRIATDGSLSVLHNFDSNDTSQGNAPNGSLIADAQGNLYGTTSSGGAANTGVLFKLSPDNQFSVVASFGAAGSTSAYYPNQGVILGSDGNFYGTTFGGGSHGTGTVYKVTPAGATTVLYSESAFAGVPALTAADASTGKLYGYDIDGVFSITPAGYRVTLRNFSHDPVYGYLTKSLILGSDGNLYGANGKGGTSLPPNYGGTLFRMKPNGTGFVTLFSFGSIFSPSTSTEESPQGIVMDSAGNLFGLAGGGEGYGAVFVLPPAPANWGQGTPPRITISAFPSTLNYVIDPNATSTIRWSTSNAQACAATTPLFRDDWSGLQPLQGTVAVPVHDELIGLAAGISYQGGYTAYDLFCEGPTGLTSERSVSVYSAPFRFVTSVTPN